MYQLYMRSSLYYIHFNIFIFQCAMIECEVTLTSTPVKRRPCKRNILEDINNTHSESSELITKKHALTPESKASGLPARKRTMTGKL